MKRPIIRILALTLAVLCLIPLAACGKKTTLQDHGSTPKAAILSYVQKNQEMLDEVADYIAGQGGDSYYFFTGTKRGASTVEQLDFGGDTNTRVECKNKTIGKLAKARFTGEVACTDSMPDGFVSFRTYLSKDNYAFYFIYCPTEECVTYITNGFFTREQTITSQPIVGNWYYVEVL